MSSFTRLRADARCRLADIRRQWQADTNITNLIIDTTSQGVIAGGVLTFMPIFLVRLGGSSLLVSLLTALQALGLILLSIPASRFVGRHTNLVRLTVRYRLLFHSLYLVIALVPFVLKGPLLPPVLVVLWGLQSIPLAIANVSWTEVIARAIPMDRMARVNGTRWAIYSVVTALSVAGFGALLERVQQPLNYQIVLFASFLAGLVSSYFFSRMRVPDLQLQTPKPAAGRNRLSELWAPLRESPAFRRYLFATFAVRLGLSLPVALYSIFWVNHLHTSDQWIGFRSTAGSLALVIGYAYWGRLILRLGACRSLVICALGIAAYPALTALIPTPPWLIPVAVLWGLFAGGIDITIFDGLLRVCPPERRTAYVGVNTVIANLAVFLGPMLGSFTSDLIGIRPAFLVAAGVGLLGSVLVGVWHVGASDAAPAR